MAKRSPNPAKATARKGPASETRETGKALREAARDERRLVEREQVAQDKVERTRQRLSEAIERLAKAQARVSRRADRLAEAEAELRLRQRERTTGPHHSPVSGSYERSERDDRDEKRASSGSAKKDDRASSAPGQEAATDLGLRPASGAATAESGSDGGGQPGQGAAEDLGLAEDPRSGR